MPSKRLDDERLGMFRAITRRLAPIPGCLAQPPGPVELVESGRA